MIHSPGNKGNLNLLFKVASRRLHWPLGAFDNRRTFASVGNVCAVVAALLDGKIEAGIYQVADDEALDQRADPSDGRNLRAPSPYPQDSSGSNPMDGQNRRLAASAARQRAVEDADRIVCRFQR